MKATIFGWLAALTLAVGALSSRGLAAAVTVYGEASSAGPAITVNVFADITNAPLVSFGVRVLYDPQSLFVTSAVKNTEAWYFASESGRVPYLEPDLATRGEVLIIGGKLDAVNPLQGVTGQRVLLGTVTFGRSKAATSTFGLIIGRAVSYANFVTTAGDVLDSAREGILFQGIWADPNDTDLDGLPDEWEIGNFGSLDKAYWSDDPDEDGCDNLHEFVADTNPNDKTSYLRVTSIAPTPGGVSLHWQGGIEATQYLERGLALDGGDVTWIDVFTNPPPTPIVSSYTNLFGTNNLMFYRVRVTR